MRIELIMCVWGDCIRHRSPGYVFCRYHREEGEAMLRRERGESEQPNTSPPISHKCQFNTCQKDAPTNMKRCWTHSDIAGLCVVLDCTGERYRNSGEGFAFCRRHHNQFHSQRLGIRLGILDFCASLLSQPSQPSTPPTPSPIPDLTTHGAPVGTNESSMGEALIRADATFLTCIQGDCKTPRYKHHAFCQAHLQTIKQSVPL